jgi:hypothetical protein
LGISSLLDYFWKKVSLILDKDLKTSTKASNIILQVLQAGYPKMLRIFHDMFVRIASLNTIGRSSVGDLSPEKTILKILASFESAYVSRSLSRLLDAVNSTFPDRNSRNLNRDDVDKIQRTISGLDC